MKVFYKKSINEKINEEINTAYLLNRKIDYIVLTKEEWLELWIIFVVLVLLYLTKLGYLKRSIWYPIHCEERIIL